MWLEEILCDARTDMKIELLGRMVIPGYIF